MNHVCIFPTWDCQNHCEYCSIRHSKVDRTICDPAVTWPKWFAALDRVLRRGDVVDIAGGEPLLYPGIVSLVYELGIHGYHWALTTNARHTANIRRLCDERPINCVCINVSDHAENPESVKAVAALRDAGFRVNVHRVDHPAAGKHHGRDAQIITYQDWSGGKATDGVRRHCTAGVHHWVADPRGDLWRCVVALETGQPPVGNLFTGEVTPTDTLCDFGCTSCYTEDPGSWGIWMEEIR